MKNQLAELASIVADRFECSGCDTLQYNEFSYGVLYNRKHIGFFTLCYDYFFYKIELSYHKVIDRVNYSDLDVDKIVNLFLSYTTSTKFIRVKHG